MVYAIRGAESRSMWNLKKHFDQSAFFTMSFSPGRSIASWYVSRQNAFQHVPTVLAGMLVMSVREFTEPKFP